MKGSYAVLWRALRLKAYRQHKGKCDWCHCKIKGRYDLHHLNGDGLDNKESNLSLLCVNCHARTKPHSSEPQLDLPLVGYLESLKGTGEHLPMSIVREQYNNCFPRV